MKIAILASALALVLAPAASAQGSAHWPALTAVAEQVAGGPVDLTCDTIHDAYEGGDPVAEALFPRSRTDWVLNRIWGYTFPQTRSVTLSPLVCAALLTAYLYPQGGEPYLLDDQGDYKVNDGLIGFAIHAFTHELGHVVLGYTRHAEGDAECFALAHETETARLLGLNDARARQMHADGLAYHQWLPSEYRDGCP